jgi:hypothetical protein
MRGFLNEASIREDLSVSALRLIYEMTRELAATDLVQGFFLNRQFFEDGEFKSKFNRLPFTDPQLKAIIRAMVFSSKHFNDWRSQRVSAIQHTYECVELSENFTDDSQCEAAEIKLQSISDCLLLGASGSRWRQFQQLHFRIQGRDIASLESLVTRNQLFAFLAKQPDYYNSATKDPPRDFQTVLIKDAARFVRTGKIERNGRRRVFMETATSYFYYVDNLHWGRAAHLEVFDSNEEHCGEADVAKGTIDRSKRVSGRRIQW